MKAQRVVLQMVWLVAAIAVLASADLSAQKTIQGEKLDPASYGPVIVESMQAAVERDKAVPRPLPPEPRERNGRQGNWKVPSLGATTSPHSGRHHAINEWGDTRMGIGFPGPVDVKGAFFAGQSSKGVWTTGIQVIGYQEGQKVKETGWFTRIGADPNWMEINLQDVDRIEIVSRPVIKGGGWYAMDDLTFSMGDDPSKPVVVNFDDLPYQYTLTGSGYAGLTWEQGTGTFEDEGVHAPLAPPREKSGEEAAKLTPPMITMNAGTPPTLLAAYQGVIRGDAGSNSYPPDTDGAIGPNHYLETVNRNFAVYDKNTGVELVNILLGSFLPGSNGDPRTLYDQHSGRWIVLVTDFSATATNFIAVSKTSDPMGDWFKSSFKTSTTEWPDYPTLGVDADGIYTAAYMVGGSGAHMDIFAIEKAPMLDPVNPQMGTITAFRNLPWEGAIHPAHTYGNPGGEYCLSLGSSSSLRLRIINPPLTAPTLSELGFVAVPFFSNPPDAPALGSTVPIDSVDDRLMMSVYRDGSLWSAHTIAAGAGAGCRWYEIDAANVSLVQSGTVTDTSLYYYMPSIMVNKNGDAVMGFSGSNSSQYVACYQTGRLASDPPGEMAPPDLYKAGTGPQNNIDGYGRNRWGDYSYTTLDPVDEETFWTIQEYGHGNNIWGTYMAVLTMIPPPLKLSLETEIPDVLSPGLSASFSIQIADGTETYVPGSGKLHHRFDGGAFLEIPLTALGGDFYEGTLPNTQPGDMPEFYFSALGSGGSTILLPKDAPASVYAFDVYFLELLFADDFETDKGWTVQNINLTDGPWERGVPIGGGDRGDPPTDFDGSGNCYLTDNVDGNSDVDGGPTILTSPKIDLSSGDAQVSYYRWHTCDDNDDPFTVEISNDDGNNWVQVEQVLNTTGWNNNTFGVSAFVAPTSQMRMRFSSIDNPNDSVTESGLDAFHVQRIDADPTLWADAYDLPAVTGGIVNFSLGAGPANANRKYLLLGSVTGTSPGFILPGGTVLPINWDLFTDLIVQNLGLPSFQNFLGNLDGAGEAAAALNTFGPLDPGLAGLKIHLAYFLAPAPLWDFASNAIEVSIVP